MNKPADSQWFAGNSAGIRMLFTHAPWLLGFELLMVLAVLWLLPERAIPASIFLWMTGWGMSVLVRVWPLVDQGGAGERALHRSVRIYIAGAFAAGVIWGVLSWLVLLPTEPAYTAFVLLLGMGVAVVGAAAQLAYPPAWLAYVVPVIVIFAERLLAVEVEGFAALALLPVILLAAAVIFLMRHRDLPGEDTDAEATGNILRDMQQKQLRAEDASREKSRFLAAASHDLRQPVHTLNLLVGSLESRAHDAGSREIVDKMREVLTGLDGLFSSLLDLSKLDADVVKPEMRVLSLEALFEGLNNEFSGVVKKKGLSLSCDAQGLFVRSDPVSLWRVLSNLLSNAVRYTEAGSIRVRCYPTPTHVRISVQDTGIGISESELPHIFNEFHQIGNEERDRSKGLGLGLAIVRKTCDMLGCSVRVSSTPGKGSVFSVEVPRAEPEAGELHPAMGELPQAVNATATAPLAGVRVLVIDDEQDVRDGMRILLSQWGCAVILAESGVDALHQIATDEVLPDILIVDYRLRERETGADAIAAVRRQCGRLIPAMILTGDTAPERIREAKQAGCPLLHKPVQPGRLLALIRHSLRQS